jgi:protein TonB
MSVVRDIGGGCGEEALRIVTLMNSMPERWTPGKQRGRPVRVMFTLPIRFKLQYN